MQMAMILILVLVAIVVPLAYALRLWRLDEPLRDAWLVVVAEACVFVAFIFVVARWDMAGMYVRPLLALIFVAAVLRSAVHHAGRPWRAAAAPPLWRRTGGTLVSLAAFSLALAFVMSGLRAGPDPRNLAFPLAGGWFVVAQGGGNRALNHHATHRAQARAADITAAGRFGFRAAGLLPADPFAYAVFGAEIVSPCAGEVIAAEDRLPDLPPPQADPANPAGNHVILACDGITVELAHMRQGSVVVTAGQQVALGAPLGQVGNSGNTTEPHLHIHASDATGAGVPLTFDGAAPVRNASWRR